MITMDETAAAPETAQEAEVEWTRQRTRLWTGRRDGRPVGTIEQGRRFTFVDTDGTRRRGHRSLDEAQTSATAAAHARSSSTWRPGRYSRPEKAVLIGSAVVLGITAVLLVVAFIVLL